MSTKFRELIDIPAVPEGIPGAPFVADLPKGEGSDTSARADLVIRGDTAIGVELSSPLSVLIDGNLLPGSVHAGTDVHAHGGILGLGRAEVVAGRDVSALSAKNAVIRAGRDVNIASRIEGCEVLAGFALDACSAEVVGCRVRSAFFVSACSLGDDRGTPTWIAIGTPELNRCALEPLDEELRNVRRDAALLARAVESLAAGAKYLNANQMRKARSLEESLRRLRGQSVTLQRRRVMLANDHESCVCLRVTRKIHSGVTVTVFGRTHHFSNAVFGPGWIGLRRVTGSVELVYLDENTGREITLEAVAATADMSFLSEAPGKGPPGGRRTCGH